MTDNPYQQPADGGTSPESSDVCNRPLHSYWSVFFATLLGSPIAGAVVIGISLIRLGRKRTAWTVMSLTMAATVVFFIAVYQMPDDARMRGYITLQLLFTHSLARFLYGRDLSRQQQQSGPIASGWIGMALGAVTCAAIVAVVLGVFMVLEDVPLAALLDDYGTEVSLGNDSVYYDGDATLADAKKLQQFLIEMDYFGNQGCDVRIRREAGKCIISFVLEDEALQDDEMLDAFQAMADLLADEGFGSPTFVELCDNTFEPAETLTGSPILE